MDVYILFLLLLMARTISGSGFWGKVKQYTFCQFTECCNDDFIPYNLTKLQLSLTEKMYGQPLVSELVNIIGAHKEVIKNSSKGNRKALVLSLHGWTGVGKNYAASIIADAVFLKGMESKFVKLFMGKKDFDCSDLESKKKKITESVSEIVRSCGSSLIIFDEIHDMCPSVLDAIKPMMDHHHAVDGVDYRDSIFIFISNIGGREIAANLLDLYDQGIKREDVEFHHFEPTLRRIAYHSGGFEKSSTIAQHLIDHYVPFLPLEQQHVELCALTEFRNHGIFNPTEEMIIDALSVITYGPTEEKPIFANNGCKRFTKQIPYIIRKYQKKIEL